MGGNVAWNLALGYTERVTALILVNATGYPEKTVPAGLRLARNPLLRRAMPRRVIERNLKSADVPRSDIVAEVMVDRAYQLMNRPVPKRRIGG